MMSTGDQSWLGWIAAGLAAAITGCSSAPVQIEAPTEEAQPQAEYRVGPGDSLRIVVFNHADLSGQVPVRPDGFVSMPLVEDVQAAGKTPSQLARDLEAKLSEYVRSPKVSVIVENFQGTPADQIKVIGQGVTPRTLPYRNNMTVMDVVIAAGGLNEFAAGNRARIIRKVNGKTVEIPVRLKDIIDKGKMETNIEVLPGDILVVPESRL
jgi:polysaccharide export outer membrane protein